MGRRVRHTQRLSTAIWSQWAEIEKVGVVPGAGDSFMQLRFLSIHKKSNFYGPGDTIVRKIDENPFFFLKKLLSLL